MICLLCVNASIYPLQFIIYLNFTLSKYAGAVSELNHFAWGLLNWMMSLWMLKVSDLVGMYYKYCCRFELRRKICRVVRLPKLRWVGIRVLAVRGVNFDHCIRVPMYAEILQVGSF